MGIIKKLRTVLCVYKKHQAFVSFYNAWCLTCDSKN